MASWDEYISNLISNPLDIDELNISFDQRDGLDKIPPIIKASVEMLDKMTAQQGKLTAFVCPEKSQLFFLFTIAELFHDISSGGIKSNFNLSEFVIGEKLKVGNAIVEFVGWEEKDTNNYIKIKLADLDMHSEPIKLVPVFQKVSTKRKLSTFKQFKIEKKKVLEEFVQDFSENENLVYVIGLRTHMLSSLFCMTPLGKVKEQLSTVRINGKKTTEIFYVGQADYEGKIRNIGPGQMVGNPALVCSSDLYSIVAAAEKGHPIHSVIIDGNVSVVRGQLDALDELIRRSIPIVYITDTPNSFDLYPLSVRGFNIWRWDKESLTRQLFTRSVSAFNNKIRNCADHTVEYYNVEDEEISEAISRLSKHKSETESLSPQMMKTFENLNALSFKSLRAMAPFSDIELHVDQQMLEDCIRILDKEKYYLDSAVMSDYYNAISCLQKIYTENYSIKKINFFKKYLTENRMKLILIIPENQSLNNVKEFWKGWCTQHSIEDNLTLMHPAEYYRNSEMDKCLTVVCGWLNHSTMQKIIYGFQTARYAVLLYDCEEHWKNYANYFWQKSLNNKENITIIEEFFSSDQYPISIEEHHSVDSESELTENEDELDTIEHIIQTNKYRQYSRIGNEFVNAIPVSFVGGFITFYQTGHEVISATKIIMSDADQIESKLPSDLRIGDFIVVREADKDLIRELADIILKNSGKQNLTAVASTWKEAVQIELVFCDVNDFCKKVQEAGCKKNIVTIKRWINDENMIAPQSKEDLQIIASVTENETLLEKVDEIYTAAQEVRSAHISAGRHISEQLKKVLAEQLKNVEDIDPYNIWDPVNVEIEGIGNIQVLKIIDIGEEIEIDRSNTNKLIEE